MDGLKMEMKIKIMYQRSLLNLVSRRADEGTCITLISCPECFQFLNIQQCNMMMTYRDTASFET